MGDKYEVRAGCGSQILHRYGTQSLVKALWYFLMFKLDRKTTFWKELKAT